MTANGIIVDYIKAMFSNYKIDLWIIPYEYVVHIYDDYEKVSHLNKLFGKTADLYRSAKGSFYEGSYYIVVDPNKLFGKVSNE